MSTFESSCEGGKERREKERKIHTQRDKKRGGERERESESESERERVECALFTDQDAFTHLSHDHESEIEMMIFQN